MGTITRIGVLPEHRGRSHAVDLLVRATADARTRGFSSILSDVETENLPMRAAMGRGPRLVSGPGTCALPLPPPD